MGGGPVMTVQRVIGKEENISFQRIDDYIRMIKGFHPGDIICQWFEGNELKFAAFPPLKIRCCHFERSEKTPQPAFRIPFLGCIVISEREVSKPPALVFFYAPNYLIHSKVNTLKHFSDSINFLPDTTNFKFQNIVVRLKR